MVSLEFLKSVSIVKKSDLNILTNFHFPFKINYQKKWRM
jgi:hypothetical protein